MTGHPIFQVDSFTDEAFRGNPAGVCLLEEPAPEFWMQAVAAEMNVAETAFVLPPRDGVRGLRWFTPTTEVDLCGHATLATSHVLWSNDVFLVDEPIRYSTRSGVLTTVAGDEGWIEMDFPAWPASVGELPGGVAQAFGVPVVAAGETEMFWLVEVGTAEDVVAASPDLSVLGGFRQGFIVCAASGSGASDIVCRVFAPGLGIDEDPATGSAQCVLGPWWAPRFGRDTVTTRQLSARVGELRVRVAGSRVSVAGRAVTTLSGSLVGS